MAKQKITPPRWITSILKITITTIYITSLSVVAFDIVDVWSFNKKMDDNGIITEHQRTVLERAWADLTYDKEAEAIHHEQTRVEKSQTTGITAPASTTTNQAPPPAPASTTDITDVYEVIPRPEQRYNQLR